MKAFAASITVSLLAGMGVVAGAASCTGEVGAGAQPAGSPARDGAAGSADDPRDGVADGGAVSVGGLGAAPSDLPDAVVESRHTYTPFGCSYEVATPALTEAGPHAPGDSVSGTADHVHVSYPNDASEGFAVNWRSDEQVTGTLLILGTDEAEVLAADTPEETETLSWRWGHHMLFTDSGGTTTRLHEVHVCGLSENSAYFYKVGAPGAWSAVYSVTTAPRKGSASPVRFAVFGDSRGLVGDVWPTTVQKAAEFGADFALFTGDAVATGTSQSQWDKFWKAAAGGFVVEEGLASLPLMVANGNHDALALNYLAQFAMPQSASTGEIGDGEQWYSFDYGPVHVVVLDDSVSSTVIEGAEADWLESDLAAVDRTETPWVFVAHHKPLYTCGSNHGPSLSSRAAWQPIYDAHGVDMVFTGHNHAYERTVPIRGLSGGEGVAAGRGANGAPLAGNDGIASGTVYILTGGASAGLYAVSDACELSQAALSAFHYVTVAIDGMRIDVRVTNSETGGLIDSFGYTKSAP